MIDARDDARGCTGSVRRQRERRFRAYLRHARVSVALALAESTHHFAPRGQLYEKAFEIDPLNALSIKSSSGRRRGPRPTHKTCSF